LAQKGLVMRFFWAGLSPLGRQALMIALSKAFNGQKNVADLKSQDYETKALPDWRTGDLRPAKADLRKGQTLRLLLRQYEEDPQRPKFPNPMPSATYMRIGVGFITSAFGLHFHLERVASIVSDPTFQIGKEIGALLARVIEIPFPTPS